MCGPTPRASSLSSDTLWLDTWRNHILHSSVYIGIIAACFHSSSASSSHGLLVFKYAIAAIAAYCLKSEVCFMWQRHRLPPGDSGWPLFGHLPTLMKDGEAFYIQTIQKYGPLSTHNLLMRAVVIVTQEDDVRWALTQERKGTTKALILPHFRKLLGENTIMVQAGETHKRLRKAFEPAFTPLAIRDYAAAIDAEAQQKLEEWSKRGDFFPPREWALLASRIFFVCAFGEANNERMVKLIYLFEKWVEGFLAPIPLNIPGTSLARAHKFKHELGQVLLEMINQFKHQNPPDSSAAKKSVLGRLCYAVDEEGNLPSDDVLVDNLRFFMFAGFDTTKASFGAISHFLKQHPHIEELLAQEVRQIGTSDDGVLDVDQLKNEAPLLNAVLAESWRLTAPLTNHATVAVQDLDYKGYHIPKGTFIGIDIQGHAKLNHGLYPQADQFCVERWLPKDHPLYDPKRANTTDIDYNVMSSKFRTFNQGPHMCLGGHFAKLEVRIVLARLYQSYKLEIRNEQTQTFPTKQLLNEFKLTKL